ELLSVIAEKEKKEQELKRSETRFEIAVLGANDGIWDWDVLTDEVYFSARWKELLGYRDNEFGSTIDDFTNLLHPDDLKATTNAFDEHIKNNKVFDVIQRIKTKTGEYRWFRSRGS